MQNGGNGLQRILPTRLLIDSQYGWIFFHDINLYVKKLSCAASAECSLLYRRPAATFRSAFSSAKQAGGFPHKPHRSRPHSDPHLPIRPFLSIQVQHHSSMLLRSGTRSTRRPTSRRRGLGLYWLNNWPSCLLALWQEDITYQWSTQRHWFARLRYSGCGKSLLHVYLDFDLYHGSFGQGREGVGRIW